MVVADGRRTRPDIVFTRQRLAVFIDGCFWHCCPDHGRSPTTNTGYWSPKLAGNVDRDELQNEALAADGWMVLRIWEHVEIQEAFRQIGETVMRLRAGATIGDGEVVQGKGY